MVSGGLPERSRRSGHSHPFKLGGQASRDTHSIIDVTAQEHENLDEDRVTREESETNPVHGMETMALTLAHRLREFNERRRGDEPENGKAH